MMHSFVVQWRDQVPEIKSPEEVRRKANEILSSRKYRDFEVKTPLNGPLSKIGDAVRSLLRWIGDVIDRIFPDVSGGSTIALVIVAIAVAALLAKVLIARVSRRSLRTQANTGSAEELSSAHWERLADEAYAQGDYRSAIVFRFRAGIVKLEKGPQPAASRQTNRVIASTAPNSFPPIAATFDGVRYGSDPGSASAAERSKQEWPSVVNEARRQVATQHVAVKDSAKQKRTGRRR